MHIKTLIKKLNSSRDKLIRKLFRVSFIILGKLPVKKNTIIFESFLGKQYSDNPRAIFEFLYKNNSDYKMYWSIDRRNFNSIKHGEIKKVKRLSLKWLYLMARAEFWISNSRLPLWVIKPNHTTYVQTWHGTPLKRLAADMNEVHMPGTNTQSYKENFLEEANKWDYLISPNTYSTNIFKRAFQYKKSVLETGYPRNDFLINGNTTGTVEEIKKKNHLPVDKKVILYAPTWRDNQFFGKGRYKFNLQLNLQQMKEKLEDDYIIVLRLHYLVAENIDLSDYEGFVYNYSKYEDIRDLYLISDILITDYSSVFFDFANLKRPMIFFTYDIEEYRDTLRGFYFNMEEKIPGPMVKTTDELIEEILKIEHNGYFPSEKVIEFYNEFCYLEDGNATKRIVEQLFN